MPIAVFGAKDEANFAADFCLRFSSGISRH
jgi:hypothetical protein